MANTLAQEQARLRKYLNPTISGRNTNAVLEALSHGSLHLINNIEAVWDQLFIVSSSGRYLDQRLSEYGIVRPNEVGLSDDIFKELGIAVKNRKQVRDLIHNILKIIYGDEFVKATSSSNVLEPYQLSNGDTLIIQFDDTEPLTITFSSSEFANISAAKAQEICDAITRGISRLNRTGSALVGNDRISNYVKLISNTLGPSSSIRVLGGSAQNKLRFDSIRPTTGNIGTQWSVTLIASGNARATWVGGANPNVAKVRKNDYVNIYGTVFNSLNRGTFTISKVQGGTVGNAYVEFNNPLAVPEAVTQGTIEDILFFFPKRFTLLNQKLYAAAYQTQSRVLEIFIPATTRVVRRSRIGSTHLQGLNFNVTVITQGNTLVKEVTQIQCSADIDGSLDGKFILLSDASGIVGFWIDETGTTATPITHATRNVKITTITNNDDATTIANKMYTAIIADPAFAANVVPGTSDTFRVESAVVGARVDGDGPTSSFSLLPDQYGPYVYDISKQYVISGVECNTTQQIDSNSGILMNVDDSSGFPDQAGYIVFDLGTAIEEGPVPIISRPSNNSLLLSPTYKFRYVHPLGSNISLITQNYAFEPDKTGKSYQFFLTDITSGRIYCEDIIRGVAALGIVVVITILYPNDIGLGKYGTEFSEKFTIWG